jgi:hypothetical protein
MELDRELAAGTSPAASPEHRTRARQLLSVHVRRELAGCVERVLARSARPPHWHSTALPIQAAAVQAGRPELERLRAALLDDHCSSCRGVALASLLLHDDHSPVYLAGTGTSVTALARAAVVALESGEFEPTH